MLCKKGTDFLFAAVLLKKNGGCQNVVLHLLCQGLEICCKAFLLLSNFPKYAGETSAIYGHNLSPLVKDVLKTYGLNELRPNLERELNHLDELYRNNFLRYDSVFDIIVNPGKIADSELVHRRLAAAVRLAERELSRHPVLPEPDRRWG